MLKWTILTIVAIALVSLLTVTFHVEREAPYRSDVLARGTAGKALILYHPSRDARFADDLTIALARGFENAGLTVERRTMTSSTPAKPEGFDVVAVVSNTYYWQPDRPTMRFLKRANFGRVPTLGIIAGAGSTQRSEAILTAALRPTGADLRGVHSQWIARPNDPARQGEDNRQVASSMARTFAFDLGRQMLADRQIEGKAAATTVPAP